MAKKKKGLHEERTRVMCNLPINNADEELAISQVIKHLEGLRRKPLGVKGFVHSPLRGSTFRGFWWDSNQQKYLREKVALFVVDYEMDFDSVDLPAQLESLRNTIQHWYQHYTGKKQEVIWVVAHPVTRLD